MIKKIFIFAILLRIIILFSSSFHPDLLNHLDWGNRLIQLGPQKFYENIFWSVSWPNQPYGSMYLFGLVKIIRDLIFNFFLFLNNTFPVFPSFIIPVLEKNLHVWLVKTPFIISDFLIGLLIIKILKNFDQKKKILALATFLFNPAVIYNSTIWGQTDSLINLLAILGIYLTFNRRFILGIPIFLLSFTFKLSLVIYLPVFAVILLNYYSQWRKILIALVISFIILLVTAWPFSIFNNIITWIIYLYQNRVLPRQGNMLNGNAFNIWFILFGPDFSKTDQLQIIFTSARNFSYFAMMVPYFLFIKNLIKQITFPKIIFSLFLIAFSAFLIMTNMHERYLYPILPLFPLLIVYFPSIFNVSQYLVISIVNLLNMYNLWFYPDISILKNSLLFSNFLLGKILSIILITYYLKKAYDFLKTN